VSYSNAFFQAIEIVIFISLASQKDNRKYISVKLISESLGFSYSTTVKIIDKLRFTREKFLFHVPVTLNFCMKNTNINEQVREIIIQNPDITFLGIDRGEKHLLYYSLIDRNGNIIEQ